MGVTLRPNVADSRGYAPTMESLSGKTAVVTGAGSGMGKAFAERFGRAGMNVVLADVEQPKLDEAVAELTAAGVSAIGVSTDVTDGSAIDRLRDAAIERFGPVHVLCNNAGVGGSGPAGGAFINEPEWRWVLEVNLWGVIHGHRAFLPHMVEHGEGGHVVNTASMAGHFPGHSAYSASKWAVVGITEGLYHDQRLRAANIGVTCLCPGWVNTAIMDSARNRPEWAAPRRDVEQTALEMGIEAFVRDQIRSGMEPTAVADLIVDAILSNTFWVFTDPTMVASLETRYQSVLGGTNPPERAFGV